MAIGHVKDKLEINISETYSGHMYNLWSLSSETIFIQSIHWLLPSVIAEELLRVEPTSEMYIRTKWEQTNQLPRIIDK